MTEKVGVFVCTGCGIGDAIDTDEFEEYSDEHGGSFYLEHECLCGPDGLAAMHAAIDEEGLDGALIAACSHRVKIPEFTFDATKFAVERVSLREQVAWSHEPGDEDTQMLADDLIRMGTARAKANKLTKPHEETIDDTVLVVGGGLAGLTAARAASQMGKPVVLVEAADQLGGYLNGVAKLVPEAPPYDRPHENEIAKLVATVESDANIRVLKGAKTTSIQGGPGQFDVTASWDGGSAEFRAGAIVQASGAKPYDARNLTYLGYGDHPDVVTSTQLEAMLSGGGLKRPSDGAEPSRVVFVQCAGSRDEQHLPYCSSECCGVSLKQAAMIREGYPDTECAIVYRDLRAPGQLEHFYASVQESGVLFTRGVVDKVTNGGASLKVSVTESLLGDDVALEADLVVLATGMVPCSADGEAIRELRDAHGRIEKKESDSQVEAAQALVDKLKRHEGKEILNLGYRQGPDLPTLEYDFPDSHYVCFPYETRRTGIYAAGAVHAPMDAAQSVEDAWGAAMKAVQCIEANRRGEAVHPRAGDRAVAEFSLQRCTQCKRCTEECPFGTINEDAKGTPEYNVLRCRRCGICLGACPERIIAFPDYSVAAVSEMIKAMEVPDEFEEKPRILAFLCENDALPALDEAAAKGAQWSSWLRIIPIRCLGAFNRVWVSDALSRGIDGAVLIGCKKGDDYQCHYIKGSELAATRMDNVKDLLDRLQLEPERVTVHELARNEFERIPELLNEFAEAIEEMEPNPYKGF